MGYTSKAFYKKQEVKIVGFDQAEGTCTVQYSDGGQELEIPMAEIITVSVPKKEEKPETNPVSDDDRNAVDLWVSYRLGSAQAKGTAALVPASLLAKIQLIMEYGESWFAALDASIGKVVELCDDTNIACGKEK